MGDRGLAGKWNHYEQSLDVPFIVYDPSLASDQRGRVISELGSLLDVAPSIVEWAGLERPSVYQGESLVKLIHGEKGDEVREEIFCEHHFERYNNWHGIRGKKYKFAVYYDEPGGPFECLYDLENDPTELVNLAANPEYAVVREQMTKRLAAYLKLFPDAKEKLRLNNEVLND